jgi:hypothetical protein
MKDREHENAAGEVTFGTDHPAIRLSLALVQVLTTSAAIEQGNLSRRG